MSEHVIDYDSPDYDPGPYKGARVLVDGREIPAVRYANAAEGIVRTLHVFFDATEAELAAAVYVSPYSGESSRPAHPSMKFLEGGWRRETLPARYEIAAHEDPDNWPLTRIIRGVVSIERQ